MVVHEKNTWRLEGLKNFYEFRVSVHCYRVQCRLQQPERAFCVMGKRLVFPHA